MSDLISRDDAINAAKKVIGDEASYKAWAILSELSEVPSANAWIPVTEARPPRQTMVIVTDWCSVTMAYINDDGKGTWMDTHGNKLKDVTAWMPLPEPPEKGE